MSSRATADVYFSIVPEWVLFADVTANAVRCYAVLRRHADAQTLQAIPSRRRLAQSMRCSTDTVDRAIKELVSIGALEVESRDEEGRTSNLYTVLTVRPPLGTGAEGPLGTGAEGPSAPVRHQEPEPLNQSHLNQIAPYGATDQPQMSSRGRDLIFEALFAIWTGRAYNLADPNDNDLTPQARANLGRVSRQLEKAGATPELILHAPEAWHAVFPGKDPPTWTPDAAAKHWPALAAWLKRGYVARTPEGVDGDVARLHRVLADAAAGLEVPT